MYISVSQFMQLKELKHNPFQKTIAKALGLNKDEFLLPLGERVKYDKEKEDYFNNKLSPDILNVNSNPTERNLSKNELMFSNEVMKENFNVPSLTNKIQQERLAYEATTNNFINENDKNIKVVFENPKFVNEDVIDVKMIGKQNVSFLRFCKAMKVFHYRTLPEEKIWCKLQ